MGISDDIVPRVKRGHYHSPSQDIEPSNHPADSGHSVDERNDQERFNIGVDDSDDDNFFSQKNKGKESPKKEKKMNTGSSPWRWIFGLLVLCVIGFVIFSNYKNIKSLFQKDGSPTTNSSSSTPDSVSTDVKPQDYTTPDTTASTTTEQSATAASTTVDKTTLKIRVLNGSGISGSAIAAKTTLEAAGFTVSSTGNAANFNYENTIIYYKTGKEEAANLVKAAITDKTSTIEKSDAIVKTNDIVVVIGKN